MTAALEGGEWSAARPGRTLLPGKTRYPFYNNCLYCIEIVTALKYSRMKYMDHLSRRAEKKKEMSTKFSTCGDSNRRAAAALTCRMVVRNIREFRLPSRWLEALFLLGHYAGYHNMHCVTTLKSEGCTSTISL